MSDCDCEGGIRLKELWVRFEAIHLGNVPEAARRTFEQRHGPIYERCTKCDAYERKAGQHTDHVHMAPPEPDPWTRFGAGRYAVEWSDRDAIPGRLAKREFSVVRMAGEGKLVELRPTLTAAVAKADGCQTPDTIRVGESDLSLDDAKAWRTALTLAIDFVEQQLRSAEPENEPLHTETGGEGQLLSDQ